MDYREKVDYSSIDTFLSCNRAMLFNYILHLRPSIPNIDLVFGSCWHYGMEVTYAALKEGRTLTPLAATKLSVAAFNKLWALTATHFDSDNCYPKNAGHAADMYYAYWKEFLEEDKAVEIIGVEIPFNIILNEDLPRYIGRLDLVTMEDGILNITDHKTSKYNTPMIFTGYEASLQTEGYLTAGNIYFDKIPKITYNHAVCAKSSIAFRRYAISRTKASIDRFLEDLAVIMTNLLHNLDLYEEEKDNMDRQYNPISFKRTGGYTCTKYFRKCSYFDLCQVRNNPFSWGVKAPQGFVHYEWDPDIHQEELKTLLKEAS